MHIKDFCKENLSRQQVKVLKKLYGDAMYAYRRMVTPEFLLKKMFKERMGYSLDLDNPKTFNEKLQWLKLHDHNPLYTTMVDKYAVKKYVADKIGEQYIIPTLGVWEHFDEIDFDKLPNQFVLKCTHDSGSVVVVSDKSRMDKAVAKEKLENGLRYNYYYWGYEWPYKNVPPRIIAEKFMVESKQNCTNLQLASHGLIDYKIHCFNGYVDSVMLCLDRGTSDTKFYFFDREWRLKRYNVRGQKAPENFTIPKPPNMEEMFSIAETLAEDFPFVRVDLYSIAGQTYFGELTFYPQSGFDSNLLRTTDEYWGDLIDLDGKI